MEGHNGKGALFGAKGSAGGEKNSAHKVGDFDCLFKNSTWKKQRARKSIMGKVPVSKQKMHILLELHAFFTLPTI